MAQKKQIKALLNQLGFRDNEAEVYLALLRLGKTTALSVARATELKRSTIYLIFDRLRNLGLATYIEQGLKRYMAAEDPTKLEAMVIRHREQLHEFMPELRALYNLEGDDSIIKYYEGARNIRMVCEALLKELHDGDDYFVYGNADRWNEIDTDFFKTFIERRKTIRLNARILIPASPKALEYQKKEREFREEVRLLPPDVSFNVNVTITPHKMFIQELDRPGVYVIQNKSIISMQRQVFNVLWLSLRGSIK